MLSYFGVFSFIGIVYFMISFIDIPNTLTSIFNIISLFVFLGSFKLGQSVYNLFSRTFIQKIFNYNQTLLINKRKNTIRVGTARKNALEIKKWQKISQIQYINLIAYNPGYEFDRYVDSNGKQQNRGKVTIPPKLSIYAGRIEYSVGNHTLSQAEYWWLAQELSDFLGLEVKIIYPTPKVPPESTCGGC